ncbi:hypothetical protein [Streptomyces sp. NPDC002845]
MQTRQVPGAAHAFRETAARLRILLDDHPCDGPDWHPDPPGVLVLSGDCDCDCDCDCGRTGSERDRS